MDTQKALQNEFDEILTLIKPLYLGWKNVQEKSYLSNWIKKLTNIKSMNVDLLHLRNLYMLAMYDNLRKQSLNEIFKSNPPNIELPALSDSLKEVIDRFTMKTSSNPSWLDNELSTQKINGNSLFDTSLDYDVDDDYVGELKYGRAEMQQCNNVNHNIELTSSGTNTTLRGVFLPEFSNSQVGLGPTQAPIALDNTNNESRIPIPTGKVVPTHQLWYNSKSPKTGHTTVTAYANINMGHNYNPGANNIHGHTSIAGLNSSTLSKTLSSNVDNINNTAKEMQDDLFVTINPFGKHDTPFDSTESNYKAQLNDHSALNKVQEKEILLNNISGMEKRLVQLQNAYHEDIMKLRNQHETEIQNVITRKNQEIEHLHAEYKDKIDEQEHQMQDLESKANECLKQLQNLQENKNKEIAHLKKSNQDNIETQLHQYEKKIASLYDDFHKEKQHLLNEHKKREDNLSKETQEYFQKLKNEFNSRNIDTNKELVNLEKDLNELKTIKTKLTEKNQQLELDKQQLTKDLKQFQMDLVESQKRVQTLEGQYQRLSSTHETELKTLKHNLESTNLKCDTIKQDLEIQAKEKIEEIENELQSVQLKLKESSRHHEIELDNVKFSSNVEKNRLKQTHESEIDGYKSQIKNIRLQYDTKIHELEKKIEFKEVQLNQITKEAELKEKMANQMIEDIRQDMTHTNERLLRKKIIEWEQIESDLNKEIVEKNREVTDLFKQLANHKHDTEQKLAEFRKWSDNQVTELTNEWKQEKSKLQQQHTTQINNLISKHGKIIEQLNQDQESKESTYKLTNEQLTNQTTELSAMISQLKEQQNQDLELFNSDKQKLIDANQKQLSESLKKSAEIKISMEKKHADHVSQILTKTNEKLKEIEEEYSSRSYQSFQLINELKSNLSAIKEEKSELIKNHESHINTITKKYTSEIDNLQRVNKLSLETYKKDIHNLHNQLRQTEKQLERKRHEFEKQLSQIRIDYESKMSKLLPIQVQTDYEETIKSLRSQINMQQQRIAILEEEVVTNLTANNSNFNPNRMVTMEITKNLNVPFSSTIKKIEQIYEE